MKSLNIFNSSLLQANKLVIPLQNHGGKDVHIYLLQQSTSIELHNT